MDIPLRLPLFPLNLVLFPKMVLPLHIFEERYKSMIGRCIEKKIPFGMLLITGDNLFDVGCSAEIVRVLERHGDGRIDILTEGRSRFRVREFYHKEEFFQEESHLEGLVEFFEDEPESVDNALLEKTLASFKEVLKLGDHETKVELDISQNPTDVSFFMSWSIGLDLAKKQEILESVSTNYRLQEILEFLEGILDNSKKGDEIKSRVRGNGDLSD